MTHKKISVLSIIWKILGRWPTLWNCIFRMLPKFFNFSGGMTRSYSVELKLPKKSFFELQKFHRITFLQTVLLELAHLMLHAWKKSEWVTAQTFEIKTNVSCTFYFYFRFARILGDPGTVSWVGRNGATKVFQTAPGSPRMVRAILRRVFTSSILHAWLWKLNF